MGKIFGVLIALGIIIVGVYVAFSDISKYNGVGQGAHNIFSAIRSDGSSSTAAGTGAASTPSSSVRGSGTGTTATAGQAGSSIGPTGPAVPKVDPKDIPVGFTAKDISPYFRKVRITAVTPGSASTASVVTLSANFSGVGFYDVTGWFVRANRNSQMVPLAVRIYTNSAPESNILLRSGETIKMYSTFSPVGKNMLMNSCSGYLGKEFAFTPALPEQCPAIPRSDIVRFTGICQDYILGLKTCEKPALNPPVPGDDYECRNYIRTLNYQGCVSRHLRDDNFLGTEWRVWVNRRFVDERHDRLLLVDKKGLLVDEYIY